MTYLFCNIGWMEHYKGQTSKDQITGGGSYVAEEGRGHEVCNFAPYRKNVYGYVQPAGKQIRIDRLGADPEDESISDITVIWTATQPDGGTVVVGWYINATVYRHYVNFDKVPTLHSSNGVDGYQIKALSKDMHLLPIDERITEIPRRVKGGMGQANVWYADAPESKPLIKEIKGLVGGKRKKASGNRSRKTDPEKNAKVEKSAINTTTKYFEEIGYTVDSVEKDNLGWDLEATLGKKKLLLEVKGLSKNVLTVELTPNEYNALSSKNKDYRLCVVSEALTQPSLVICRYSKESQAWIVEGNDSATVEVKTRQSANIEISI